MPDQRKIVDYQADWTSGMNSGAHPAFISLNQCADAINLSFRGGKPRPRSPVFTRALNFSGCPDGGTYFLNGIYQGGCYYNTANVACLIVMIGGRVYSLTPKGTTLVVVDLTPDAGNPATDTMCWLVQADRYLIIQNGSNVPYVVKDATAKRADGTNPIPVGTAMAYGQGRLWVASGQEFYAGDLIGSEDDAVLTFSEAIYLNEGGAFSLPTGMGDVVAMHFIAQQDTATGQGQLLIFGETGVASVDAIVPRDQWKNTSIQHVTLLNIGSTGHRSLCDVNGDVWFLAYDGWRTYRQARALINGWNQVPLSQPVGKYTDADSPQNRRFISAVNWDNRLLCTSGPVLTNGSSTHMGVLSLDFDPIAQDFTGAPTPSWDGFWKFPKPVCELLVGIFDGQRRCFAFSHSGQNLIQEIVREGMYDNGTTVIQASLTTRRYTFSSAPPYFEKQLIGGSALRLSAEDGTRSVKLEYKQDDSSIWQPWQTLSRQWPAPNCSPNATCEIPCVPDYFSRWLKIVDPADVTASATGTELTRRFFDLQCRISWLGGYFQLESLQLKAQLLEMDQNGEPQILS